MGGPDGLVLYRPDGRLTVEYRLRGRRIAFKLLRDLLVELMEAETGLTQLSENERVDLAVQIASELRRLADSVTTSQNQRSK